MIGSQRFYAEAAEGETVTDAHWHILRDGNAEGPISFSELQRHAQSGSLARADMVWHDGLPDWVQAGTIKGLFCGPPPPPKLSSVTAPALLSTNESPSGRVDAIANRRLIAQLREDAADGELLWPEFVRVALRLNPVNRQIYEFLGFIHQVTESTPRYEIARFVQEAMQQVDLTNAVPMLDEALDFIANCGPWWVKSATADLLVAWPEAKQVIRHRWANDPEKEGESYRQQLRCAVQTHRQDLVVIQNHYRQLQEFHPRYHAIMTRSSVWESILGFAAGFFGGSLGVIGAEAWDNWRGQSDSEFAQSFGNAVDQFSGATLAFTQKTEQEVESVLAAIRKDSQEFTLGTMSALESLAEHKDLTAIYRKLHEPDPTNKPDDEGRQLFEIVLSNLREQRISARSEANLRALLQLG